MLPCIVTSVPTGPDDGLIDVMLGDARVSVLLVAALVVWQGALLVTVQ